MTPDKPTAIEPRPVLIMVEDQDLETQCSILFEVNTALQLQVAKLERQLACAMETLEREERESEFQLKRAESTERERDELRRRIEVISPGYLAANGLVK